MKVESLISNIEPGDIILISGSGKSSQALIKGQRIFYSNAVSSHVMVTIDKGAIIHAMPDGGVQASELLGVLDGCNSFRVIRMKKLTDEQRSDISIAAVEFLEQAYNIKFYQKHNQELPIDESSFCSQLIQKVFNKIEGAAIQFPEKYKRDLYPCDLDRIYDEIKEESDWIDVTDKYEDFIRAEDINDYMFMCGHALLGLKTGIAKRKALHKPRQMLYAMIKEIFSEEAKNKIEELEGRNKSLNCWFDKERYQASDKVTIDDDLDSITRTIKEETQRLKARYKNEL